jgi:hypothetical protein
MSGYDFSKDKQIELDIYNLNMPVRIHYIGTDGRHKVTTVSAVDIVLAMASHAVRDVPPDPLMDWVHGKLPDVVVNNVDDARSNARG